MAELYARLRVITSVSLDLRRREVDPPGTYTYTYIKYTYATCVDYPVLSIIV
jgi:hypothetical protein